MQGQDVKGFLKKLKTSKLGRLFGNTNTRWFECLFKERIFGYKDKTTDLKLRSSIKFEEITDFSGKLSIEDAKMCDWRFGFQIITKDRVYILYCEDKESLEKWTFAFNTILKRGPKKLAVIETPNFSAFKPKSEVLKNPVEDKRKKTIENPLPSEKEVVITKEKEVKREEYKPSEIKAPESYNKPDAAIVMDEDDVIEVKQEENNEEKPKIKREEYKAEKPKHVRNYIPELVVQKPNIKANVINKEFDDNIINLINEADKSFDNITTNNTNLKDKFYRQNKKNVRSSSAINVESHGQSSNYLKAILQKENEKKNPAALVSKEIHDWNYYDNQGNLIQEDENPYNPANEGTKEERIEKSKKKAIANLLLGGVHLGIESDEENDKSAHNLKNTTKDSILFHNNIPNDNNPIGQIQPINKDTNVYDYFIDNKINNSDFNIKEEEKPQSFVPKSILNNIILYDNKKPNIVKSNNPTNLPERIKIEGLEHPEIKRNIVVIDPERENEEISQYFQENKQDVQESIYKHNNETSIIKPPIIKAFKKLEYEFEDLDFHNQKQTVSKSNKVVLNKPNTKTSTLHKSKIGKENINQQNKHLNNSNLLGDLEAFDSNPDLTNTIMLNNNNVPIESNIGEKREKEKNNMNSSFVEDLTEDW